MWGRDLEGVINAGQAAVKKAVHLPEGYHLDWGGEYSELVEAKSQLVIIGPLAALLIFMILFALYGNLKFPLAIALGVVLTGPVGALVALKLTHTPFSVSSVLGLLAVLGVSVQTAVILVSYINKLRNEGLSIHDATLQASLLRLRPIMMTALVACLGLLPAAMATGVGSDTQKPFAIVVVAGLISRLLLGFFVNPVLYQIVAREGDVLQVWVCFEKIQTPNPGGRRGGTHVKARVSGNREERRIVSGPTMTAARMVRDVKRLVKDWKYDAISIGYPGIVIHGRPVHEPHNLGGGWVRFDFGKALRASG